MPSLEGSQAEPIRRKDQLPYFISPRPCVTDPPTSPFSPAYDCMLAVELEDLSFQRSLAPWLSCSEMMDVPSHLSVSLTSGAHLTFHKLAQSL